MPPAESVTPAFLPEAVVSPEAIRRNIEALRARIGTRAELAAVVKGDGYGHGLATVARAAIQAGLRWLVVSTVDEGVILRRTIGPAAELLVLGPIFAEQADAALDARLIVCVGHLEAARALDRAARSRNQRAPAHLHIDTGMGRYGFISETDALDRALDAITAMGGLDVQGLSTHLSESDLPDSSFTGTQMMRFATCVEKARARGLRPRWLHAGNSGAIVHFPDAGGAPGCNLVRAGLALYGVCPGPQPPTGWPLEPAMTFRCRVADVRHTPPGMPVSYGRTYHTRRPSRLAVLAVGYGDGYPRPCSAGAQVIIRGRRAPVVGRVTMNTTMADVTDVDGVEIGDPVLLFGRGDDGALLRVEELAATGGLIPYEILCQAGRMSQRVELGQGNET